jgi:hypothetical protein
MKPFLYGTKVIILQSQSEYIIAGEVARIHSYVFFKETYYYSLILKSGHITSGYYLNNNSIFKVIKTEQERLNIKYEIT